MIAPQGYIPFTELLKRAEADLVDCALVHLIATADSLEIFTIVRKDDIILSWAIGICRYQLYLTNGGSLTKIDANLLLKDRFQVDLFVHPLLPNSNNSKHCISAAVPPQIEENYNLCDPIHPEELEGEICFQHIEEVASLPGGANVPLFVNQHTMSIDFSLWDWLATKDCCKQTSKRPGADSREKLLRPFDGFTLCVSQEWVSNNWSDSIDKIRAKVKQKHYKLLDDESLEFGISTQVGRPSHAKEIREFYDSNYPDGHSSEPSVTWKVVNNRLREETGISVDVSTVKRAINRGKTPRKM